MIRIMGMNSFKPLIGIFFLGPKPETTFSTTTLSTISFLSQQPLGQTEKSGLFQTKALQPSVLLHNSLHSNADSLEY